MSRQPLDGDDPDVAGFGYRSAYDRPAVGSAAAKESLEASYQEANAGHLASPTHTRHPVAAVVPPTTVTSVVEGEALRIGGACWSRPYSFSENLSRAIIF